MILSVSYTALLKIKDISMPLSGKQLNRKAFLCQAALSDEQVISYQPEQCGGRSVVNIAHFMSGLWKMYFLCNVTLDEDR